jgi:hypothetical protein
MENKNTDSFQHDNTSDQINIQDETSINEIEDSEAETSVSEEDETTKLKSELEIQKDLSFLSGWG